MIDLPGHSRRLSDLPVFSSQPWQMSYGERTVIEGVLSMLKPRLAIEIGRAEGGSLRRIAAHSDEILSFDIVEAPEALESLVNVTALSGDSHAQLPIELKRIADEGRNVDFVLVDGDHTSDGVRRDVQDLLDSDAIVNTIILAHDTLNEEVRQGLTEINYEAYEKVVWTDLDFVPGYVADLPERLGECWGGLGLIVVNADGAFRGDGKRHQADLVDQPTLVWPVARYMRREGEGGGSCRYRTRPRSPPASGSARIGDPDRRSRAPPQLAKRDPGLHQLAHHLTLANSEAQAARALILTPETATSGGRTSATVLRRVHRHVQRSACYIARERPTSSLARYAQPGHQPRRVVSHRGIGVAGRDVRL